ncbi:phospholipase D-like domain-containing protein [Coprococcus comes ATCC 27758]|nr:phospholipase D-like domain-containing protein [Coprococcus comes]QRT50148.1 recombinase family protein [Coprococcus comes]UWP12721.1 phospholipase D-like domain-containing protein [Coprococcus comes ATCC 27758]
MAGIRMENKIYEVGMYCRLSKDDGTDNESASIATQKSILTDYVKKQGWHLAKTYVDDGYSGTNFQRPSFQNMIKDIESGLINCVITKDLSRLGRNYLDCGLYLEVFFPEHNVRYIAVNDGVDTLNKSAMDITPFRNILNEMYSADVSVKIKSAYRARFQQGKFMGTTAPYGYVKDPADHNHLLIDDKVAHVVREIFDLALAGNGIAKIRKHINKQHILRPAAYAAEQGATGYERYFEENEENRYIWSENSVRGILRSPIYAGNLAGYKRIAANMKSKKRPSKLPEEWEVIPDTHEGIVTQEEFDTVQQLITSRRLPENKGGFENIFAGVIKCADCGYAMRAMSANRRKRPDIIDCVQYSCNNYGRYGNIMCTAHSIEARDLFNAVLTDINRFADMAVNDEKAVRAIEKRLTETDQSKAKALEKEQRKLNKRLAELDRLFSSLYEDKVMERITERNFEMMGSIGFINTDFVKKMERIGIHCRVFNPFMPGLNLFLNNRDHRKITVIDGKVGFTGGYNLANEYFNYTHPYGQWKDTGIRLEGDAVQSLTVTFLEMWNAVSDKDANDSDFSKYLFHYDYAAQQTGFVQPYADSPMDNEQVGEEVYISMINKAEKYCWFMTPYLIITDEMTHALCLAAKRGVDVRIITPGIPDKKFIYNITRSFYHGLVKHGVRVYEWTPGFCHAKMSVADDCMATCGTINLDYRSLYHHFENGCFMADCQAVVEIKNDLIRTMGECRDVTDQYQTGRSAYLRLGQLFMRLFAGLL